LKPGHKAILIISASIIAVIINLLGGCGCGENKNVSTENETIEKLAEQYKDDPELFDKAVYAQFYDISVEEAQERFDIADKFSGLDSLLEEKEPDTFAGLWIQHEPDYCIVTAFTSGGEETIKKYISEDLLKYISVRTVKYSMKQMWQDRYQVEDFLKNHGILFTSGIYVMDNRVEITVTDRTEIDKGVTDGELVVPESVLIKVGPLPTPV